MSTGVSSDSFSDRGREVASLTIYLTVQYFRFHWSLHHEFALSLWFEAIQTPVVTKYLATA